MKCAVFSGKPGVILTSAEPLPGQEPAKDNNKSCELYEEAGSDMMDIQNKPLSPNVIPSGKTASHHKEGYTRTSSLKLKTGRP